MAIPQSVHAIEARTRTIICVICAWTPKLEFVSALLCSLVSQFSFDQQTRIIEIAHKAVSSANTMSSKRRVRMMYLRPTLTLGIEPFRMPWYTAKSERPYCLANSLGLSPLGDALPPIHLQEMQCFLVLFISVAPDGHRIVVSRAVK